MRDPVIRPRCSPAASEVRDHRAGKIFTPAIRHIALSMQQRFLLKRLDQSGANLLRCLCDADSPYRLQRVTPLASVLA